MRAAVYHGRRDVRIMDIPEPGEPAGGEVVLEVLRAAICGTDSAEWDHGPLLARPPVTLGHEFVGRVTTVGEDVAGVSVGERVVSGAGVWCGNCEWCQAGSTNLCAEYYTLGLHADGGLAEYVAVPARTLHRVPDPLTDDAAALAQPQAVALHAVRRSGLQPGEACAVIGVGGIGAFIVAAAAGRGASPLIAIDIDDERLGRAKRLGATEAIHAIGRDLTKVLRDATVGAGAHVVIEASGAAHAPAAALDGARRGGRVLLVGLQGAPCELDLLSAIVREVDVLTTVAHVCDEDLPEALAVLEKTNVAEVVIDRAIGLDDLVAAGIAPLAEHTAKGKIVVNPQRL